MLTALYVLTEEQNVRGNDGNDGINDGLEDDVVVGINEGFHNGVNHEELKIIRRALDKAHVSHSLVFRT